MQILVFLIVAAALGFALGWLMRASRLQAEGASGEADLRARVARLEDERDRLRAELAAAGGAGAAAGQRAAADSSELAARITQLQDELARAQAANARHQAEVGRLEARIADLEAGAAVTTPKAVTTGRADPPPAERAGLPPAALARPEGTPDDLQQISGIGPGIERTLHQLGIFHFRQIAAFTPDNVAWVNQHLRFKGRIEREDWIGQAKRLAAGGQALQ
jgi:predicted flap endonuclease-1-like 5' DNA nuclease